MSLFRFMQDRRGGVAPMFALAIIPVFGLVGAAVDYSRASSIRAGMQSSLDATALAMAKIAPTLTQAQLKQKSTDYFNAMFNHPDAKNLDDQADLHHHRRLAARHSASGSMDTSFMNLHGLPEPEHRQHLHGEVGQQPPARRARARQHGLDGRRRQDGRR